MNNGNSRTNSRTDSRKMNADIVILAAGVMGASIAFHLAKRGVAHQQGTRRPGRQLAFLGAHPATRLKCSSRWRAAHVPELREAVGEAGDFRKAGFVRIVHPGETERLMQNVEMQRNLGVNVKLIDRAELRELEPDWAVDDVELAAYEPDSGYGDGPGVANGFLAGAGSRRSFPVEVPGSEISCRG